MSMNFPGQATSNFLGQTEDPTQSGEEVVVDLNAEVEAANPEADFNEILPPPPAGAYIFKLELGEKGVVPSQTKTTHQPFVSVYLLARLVDDGSPNDGFLVNYYLNSIVRPRSGTSEVHHLMSILGNPLPNKINLGDMKTKIEETLASSPLCPAYLDWRCSYNSGQKDQKTGKDIWIEQYKRMDQFPKLLDEHGNWTGLYNHIVKSKLDGSVINAQGYITKILTNSEFSKLRN